jgi:predicted amidohydrolase
MQFFLYNEKKMKKLKTIWLVLFLSCASGGEKVKIIGMEMDEPVKGKTIRVFAIGHKVTIDTAESEKAFFEKINGMIELVKDKFSNDYPNLLVFPEDTGLVLSFFGIRGEEGRKEKNVLNAFLTLLTSYSEAFKFYKERFKDISIQRNLFLALTDSLWRPFFNTFSALAKMYKIYIVSCTNVAEVKKVSDPQLNFLRDPSVQSDYVYVAESKDVWNTCFLFNPDGDIVYKVKKVHLVPEEESLLDLSKGKVEDAEIYRIPGTEIDICLAICADAFYEDYAGRMDEKGCDVIVQPSANPGMWAYFYPYWQPEDWLRSTMGSMQFKNIQYNINPMMTGNFFDMVFDGQSAITGKKDPRIRRDKNYIGNEPLSPYYDEIYPEGGFLLMAPWAIEDPGIQNPALSLDERRSILMEKSISLLSPSACESMKIESRNCGTDENQYIESILWTDIVIK